jgi:hypothetical protein
MKKEFLEMKHRQLLKDYRKLTKKAIRDLKAYSALQALIRELAEHMNLKDIGSLTPEEIIKSAKGRIAKIHLINR